MRSYLKVLVSIAAIGLLFAAFLLTDFRSLGLISAPGYMRYLAENLVQRIQETL